MLQTIKTVKGTIEYRIAGGGDKVAVIFPGGHMDASVVLGEEFFVREGYRVVVLSRPGYGKTSLDAGPSPDEFADVVAELAKKLSINQIVAVGISAGGRSAVRLAANYPQLVKKLILQSATSFMPWPDPRTRRIARIVFSPGMQKYTWRMTRWLLRNRPNFGLRIMLGNMTTLRPSEVVSRLSQKHADGLLRLFGSLRSDEGFMNDLNQSGGSAKDVRVPTLIIHSKYDKSVSLEHAERLHSEIANSQLVVSDAESHMIWFSDKYDQIQQEMRKFLKGA